MGQQAALGADLRDFMDGLDIADAIFIGYDWGGRAACVAAALWPERAHSLISINGYNIQYISSAVPPGSAAQEHRYWYQWYFHTERGRLGLEQNRRDLVRLLWQLWSPNWRFTAATFEAIAASFDNPDFVVVTVQSYRHRYRNAPGDPALEPFEARLAERPTIAAPTIVLHGACDGVGPPEQSESHAQYFTGPYERRGIPVAGHFLSRERPERWSRRCAICLASCWRRSSARRSLASRAIEAATGGND